MHGAPWGSVTRRGRVEKKWRATEIEGRFAPMHRRLPAGEGISSGISEKSPAGPDKLSRMLKPAFSGAAAGLFLALAGCRASVHAPDLGAIYDTVARAHGIDRNPVIVLPGVLGSNLTQEGTGRVVWGAFVGDYANPSKADGARLVALPMEPGVPLSELRDDVFVDGALESLKISLFGLPIGVSAYVNILLVLGVGGYRDQNLAVNYGDDHFTCFQFAYDWRRDVSENAVLLHDFIVEKKAEVEAAYSERYGIEKDVRFDVVAHSMGGLVLRTMLRYGDVPLPDDGSLPELTWEGTKHIERAVLIAPPNAGAAQAFFELQQGSRIGPFLPVYPAAVLATMPAVYQLLPRPRHGAYVGPDGERIEDALDPELWERAGFGLAHADQDRVLKKLLPDVDSAEERRAIALDHQAKCLRRAEQLFRALDAPAEMPDRTTLILAAGDSIDTPAVLRLDPATGGYRLEDEAHGDGTVLRSSALMDERLDGEWTRTLRSPVDWDRVLFFFDDHLGLTRNETFMDNLLFLLLEEPR